MCPTKAPKLQATMSVSLHCWQSSSSAEGPQTLWVVELLHSLPGLLRKLDTAHTAHQILGERANQVSEKQNSDYTMQSNISSILNMRLAHLMPSLTPCTSWLHGLVKTLVRSTVNTKFTGITIIIKMLQVVNRNYWVSEWLRHEPHVNCVTCKTSTTTTTLVLPCLGSARLHLISGWLCLGLRSRNLEAGADSCSFSSTPA
jgi:hypothetical protein